MLEKYIREKLKKKKILLMTHIVIGYPSLEESFEAVKAMAENGVDMMELQIPFSEPIADGPVILNANQMSLAKKITVRQCLDFAEKAAKTFKIPFMFMSYYNILHKFGVNRFVGEMVSRGLNGAIVPDLPLEEGEEYLNSMKENHLDPIMLFAPTTPTSRMEKIARLASGFIYCVARKGITGMKTDFSGELENYLNRCRKAANLPLALGFGVKNRDDISFLEGKADVAIIGTQSILAMEKEGIPGLKRFILSLQ